jgi:alanine-synthesizing transaminase
MFAKRTHWTLTPNTITKVKGDLLRAGISIIDLTESNPTHCDFSYLSKKILAELAKERNLRYEPSPQGLLSAREALCRFYGQKGLNLHPERILLTASTSEAYSFLFRLLAEQGDPILCPRPSYPLFEFLCDLNDARQTTYPLRFQERWTIDREAFDEALTDETKAIVLVNPNNPTGSFVQQKEINFLKESCVKHDRAIISDEVFHEFNYSECRFPSLAEQNECLTFTLGGISKTLGLPQMKVSWIIISGPEQQMIAARERLEVIADTYLSVNTPAQNALATWLELQPVIQEEIIKRVRRNRSYLVAQLKDNPTAKLLPADGGWYAVLRCPNVADEEDVILKLLEKDQVFVHPGYFFDFEESGYFVISLLPKKEIFQQGAQRFLSRIQEEVR